MRFGEIKVEDAKNTILAHSIKDKTITLKKGHRLSEDDCKNLKSVGITHVVAARLEDGDVHEDTAAAQIADALRGDNVSVTDAFTGRCNITAKQAGLIRINAEAVDSLNAIHESVTLATLPDLTRVAAGQIVATVKIIPFAVNSEKMKAMSTRMGKRKPSVRVQPFKRHTATIVNTISSALKPSIIEKTTRLTRQRIESVCGSVNAVLACDHNREAVASVLKQRLDDPPDLFVIVGASVTVDRADVVPAGIEDSGGQIIHFGMPVDPGNLVLIARYDNIPILVLPGCARSPKLNGIDWILERYAAGLDVTPADIMSLGVGGLLIDSPVRPLPRDQAVRKEMPIDARPKIAALILAAGQSRRMGGANKLLEIVDGVPMVKHTVQVAMESRADPMVVVTGHQHDAVEDTLHDLSVELVLNPRFTEGMSTSLHCGLAALPDDVDGVVICLGDMPSLTPQHIDALIEEFDPEAGRAIGVPVHKGKRGNPVLFARRFFSVMSEIQGDVGARHLIGDHADLVYEVEFGDTAVLVDLDTPEAWSRFRAERKA